VLDFTIPTLAQPTEMDLSHLEESGIGLVPNVEERAALETEMRKRKVEEKLERYVWGGRGRERERWKVPLYTAKASKAPVSNCVFHSGVAPKALIGFASVSVVQHSILGPCHGNKRRGLHRRVRDNEHDGDTAQKVLLHVSYTVAACMDHEEVRRRFVLSQSKEATETRTRPSSATTCRFPCRTSKNLSLQHNKAASDPKLQTTRFTGNPSKLLGPDADAEEEEEPEEEAPEGEEGAEPAEDAPPKKPRRVKFSEAHRLHFTCKRIDSECGVVPRGAFAVTPTHHVVINRSFVGISATDADNIASYCHFRPATGAARKGALARAAVVGAGDFLDPLSEDEPKGIWSSVLSLGRGSVQLRNARWPGYFFWHEFETSKFGSIYQGDGRRNEDLSWSI
jgi:hypothetical protein